MNEPIGRFWILNQAAIAVSRNQDHYGAPEDCFSRIAVRWSQTFGVKVEPWQVAHALIDVKMVRVLNDPRHLDNDIDIAGYAGCLGEVAPK